ncbi:Neural Wiskott-Aldrich syndrome protein [Orchesella cincta]|uniref:Neural Wiskott-Aldrich syndrome protein n=1 Tax=Orchesella cincta TaxID=48709 RepID=A0A1D2N6P7_ORCCI|nr:Neural Wiskott-Aldrich syndrome protein [Orchesella cincta]
MSNSVYSTFRTPQPNRQRSFLNGATSARSSSTRGMESLYAAPSNSNSMHYFTPQHPGGSATLRRSPTVTSHEYAYMESRVGNGFSTLPSSFNRGVRGYDPLNTAPNRFKRRTDSFVETGSLNNFDFYRSQQGGSVSPSPDYDANMSYQQPVMRKPPPENKPSLLLSPDENRLIFEILGRGRQTLATAVGRLLVPTPDQQQWQKKDSTGAVCLVRDTTKKSYFIQVFSLRAKNMIFRQEIYNQFEYQMQQATFMTFEGDSSMVAILFADGTEACNFREALDSKLEAKRQRRSERETRKSRVLETQVNNVPPPQSNNHYASNNVNTTPSYPNGNTVTTTYTFSPAAAVTGFSKLRKSKGKEKDNKKKTKLTAKDIGTPMDFRHVQHVGWDPNKGFDLNLEDKHLRTFFEKAGVSATQLNDEKTRKFIYNFMEQHGVVDLVKNASSTTPPRAPPPIPPSSNNTAGPPPVPTRTPSIPNSNYPTSNKPPPPPPPPSRPVPPPPPAATYPGGSAAAPPPPPLRTTSSAIQNSPTPQYQQQSVSNGPSRPPMPKPSAAAVNGPSSAAPPPPPPPPPMPVGGGAPPPPPPTSPCCTCT